MTRLWTSRGRLARAGRLGLLPLAGAFGLAARLHGHAYRSGWLRRVSLPLPAVSVGNLAVGGAGKTPMAAWIAAWVAARGQRPGILLRGYGRDEGAVHREANPGAVVVEDPDRGRGAALAQALGAHVLVLDDGFQHHRVLRNADIVLISAESAPLPRWSLPAGPWREGWSALQRAALVVVTAKVAPPAQVKATLAEIARIAPGRPTAVARLRLGGLSGLRTRARLPLEVLRGARVLAACGIADPVGFRRQLEAAGAHVSARTWRDHHWFRADDVRWMLRAATKLDYVVLTAKDAVKLRALWPAAAAEALVARLDVDWEHGRAEVDRLLHTCLGLEDESAWPAPGVLGAAAGAADGTA